jgi:glycosyltransferase involved in cell wall biosynthesis
MQEIAAPPTAVAGPRRDGAVRPVTMTGLAYIMGTFPALTETFITREIKALQDVGLPVERFSLRRPSRADALAEGDEFVPRTSYGPSWRDGHLWGANARMLAHAWRRYVAVLAAVIARTAGNPVHCLKVLALFPVAVAFAERMRDRGITHVHAHWAIYPASAAYIVARLLGISFSFTAHAHDARAIRSLMREKVRRAAFVVTCTAWTQAWLRRLVPEAGDKILLNYHGVALDRFAPDPSSRLAGPDELTIVSCGSLYPRKGLPYLLEACRLLRNRGWNFHGVIIGDGPMRGPLQHLIDRHGLTDRVRLVGAVAPGEIARYYRDADVFALACITARLGWRDIMADPLLGLEVGLAIPFRPWMDGIPNALLEAMAMALPVVSTRVAGIPEVIESGHTGILVGQRDPEALAQAIEDLFRDPGGRREMGWRARDIVSHRFDRRRTIRAFVEVFASRGRPCASLARPRPRREAP